MYKTLKILFFVCIAILCLYFLVINLTDFKGTYKLSGTVGYSENIAESKKRGVFVKELKYKIKPDSLKLSDEVLFFIEKRWRYGKNSAEETLPIGENELKYNYSYGSKLNLFRDKKYSLGKGDSARFNRLIDTLKIDIIYRKDVYRVEYDYDNIPVLGELILFSP